VAEDADAGTPAAGASASPALDPTPHHVLDSMMKRNALYESPPASAVAAAAATPADAAGVAGAAAGAQPPAAPPSPTSALAALLAPVLTATIKQIEADERAMAQGPANPNPAPERAASPGADAHSSPADFYGFPRLPACKEATSGASSPEHASDGVPRDSEGVPRLTPATVTVRRGSYNLDMGGMLEDDGLATQLFTSFSPDAGDSPAAAVSPTAAQQQGAEPSAGPASAAASEVASPEFSFFPAATSSRHAAGPSMSPRAGGATPELVGAYGPGSATISPEILGFHESQAQQRQGAAAAAGAATSQAGGLPALPK
jgi:hypothetical protein